MEFIVFLVLAQNTEYFNYGLAEEKKNQTILALFQPFRNQNST